MFWNVDYGESVLVCPGQAGAVVSSRWFESQRTCTGYKVSGARDYDYDTRDKSHLSALPYASFQGRYVS